MRGTVGVQSTWLLAVCWNKERGWATNLTVSSSLLFFPLLFSFTPSFCSSLSFSFSFLFFAFFVPHFFLISYSPLFIIELYHNRIDFPLLYRVFLQFDLFRQCDNATSTFSHTCCLTDCLYQHLRVLSLSELNGCQATNRDGCRSLRLCSEKTGDADERMM